MSEDAEERWDPTADGWPHPIDWVRDLSAKVFAANERYREAIRRPGEDSDWDEDEARADATVHAKAMLTDVLLALNELPAFRQNGTLRPLTDLMTSLDDLERGRSSPMFKPRPAVAKGLDSTADSMVKHWAVISVLMLEKVGFTKAKAYAIVAEEFSLAGWGKAPGAGQQRTAGISPSTIVGWCNPKGRLRKEFAAAIDRELARFKAAAEWPYSKERAIRIVRGIARSDRLAEYKYACTSI